MGKRRKLVLLAVSAVLTTILLLDRFLIESATSSAPEIANSNSQLGTFTKTNDQKKVHRLDELGKNPLAKIGSNRLKDTSNRPLFEETRRPVKATEIQNKNRIGAKPSDEEFVLLGTVVGSTGSVALIKSVKSGKNFRILEGEEINNWELVNVKRDKIFLKQKNKLLQLTMHKRK